MDYYRPISVLPVISKTVESVIHEQLSEYYIVNEILSTAIWFSPKKNNLLS